MTELGLAYVDLNDETAAWLEDLNVKTIYNSLRWCNVQPNSMDHFNWSTYDFDFSLEKKYGIQSVRSLSHTPAWASKADTGYPVWTSPPNNMAAWANFIKELVKRYPGRTWTIWAEPDNYPPRESQDLICWTGSAADYGELLKTSYLIGKREDPSCTIGIGGLVGATINGSYPYAVFGKQNEDRFVFLEELSSKGYLSFCDFIGLDCYAFGYGGFQNIRHGIHRARGLSRRKTLWIMETGCKLTRTDKIDSETYKKEYGHEPVTQETSAGLLLHVYQVAQEYDIPRVFWLTLKQSDWGLVNRLGKKYLTYNAFKLLSKHQPTF